MAALIFSVVSEQEDRVIRVPAEGPVLACVGAVIHVVRTLRWRRVGVAGSEGRGMDMKSTNV